MVMHISMVGIASGIYAGSCVFSSTIHNTFLPSPTTSNMGNSYSKMTDLHGVMVVPFKETWQCKHKLAEDLACLRVSHCWTVWCLG
jgi:hypothetical protein